MSDEHDFTILSIEAIDPPAGVSASNAWHELAGVSIANESWRVRVRSTAAPVQVGDTLRLDRAELVATMMPETPEGVSEQVYQCDRLDGGDGFWETDCDWSEETLANLAARIRHEYHEGDRGELVEMALRALAGIVEGRPGFELGPIPCDPRTADHVMYQAGPVDAVAPLVVLVQMALAHSDAPMLNHVRTSVSQIPRMHGWLEACDHSAARFGQVEGFYAVVAADPGIKQTEVGAALDMDPAIARSIGYLLHWAGRIGREKDGRTNRLHPA